VPPSDRPAIDVRLPGCAVRVPPGEKCSLALPE